MLRNSLSHFDKRLDQPDWDRGGAICNLCAYQEDLEVFHYIDHTCNFLESLVRKDNGKLERMDLHPITLDYPIVVPPERGTTNRRLVWIPSGYHAAWVTMTLHVEGISCYYGVK